MEDVLKLIAEVGLPSVRNGYLLTIQQMMAGVLKCKINQPVRH